MRVTECDGCGQQARNAQQLKTFQVLSVSRVGEPPELGDSRDFCQTCMDKIGLFIGNELK